MIFEIPILTHTGPRITAVYLLMNSYIGPLLANGHWYSVTDWAANSLILDQRRQLSPVAARPSRRLLAVFKLGARQAHTAANHAFPDRVLCTVHPPRGAPASALRPAGPSLMSPDLRLHGMSPAGNSSR